MSTDSTYDNGRKTSFNSSVDISDNALNLNSIYEFNSALTNKLWGKSGGSEYYVSNDYVNDFDMSFNSNGFERWNERNNIFYKKLFNLKTSTTSTTAAYALLFNAYKLYQFYGENLEAGYWIVDNTNQNLTLNNGIVHEIYMHFGGTGPENTSNVSASTGSNGDRIFTVNNTYNLSLIHI